MEFVEFMKAYRDFGYFGLWIATIILFYRDLVAAKKEMLAITIQTTIALDKSSTAMADGTVAAKELKSEVAALRSGNDKFEAFLRGRDDAKRDIR